MYLFYRTIYITKHVEETKWKIKSAISEGRLRSTMNPQSINSHTKRFLLTLGLTYVTRGTDTRSDNLHDETGKATL